jgi:protein SCO1/2
MGMRRFHDAARILVGAAILAAGPGGGEAAERQPAFHGIYSPEQPRAADFTLTAQAGRRVALSDFRGKLVLLYFGYTHCPGICPATLAEIAQARRALGPVLAATTQVVMVSVDPERDTPQRLAAYLGHFDPSFLGLTGTPDEIATVATRYGIYYRRSEGTPATGYVIDHTSMTIVVDGSGHVRLLFPFGTTAEAIAEDLGHLLAGRAEAAGGGPQIRVEKAWARPMPSVATSSEFYMVLINTGSRPDRLVTARSPACGKLELYEASMDSRGAMGMRPVPAGYIEVPAGGRVELKVGGLHLMCLDKKRDLSRGTRLPVRLTFQESKEIVVDLTVR